MIEGSERALDSTRKAERATAAGSLHAPGPPRRNNLVAEATLRAAAKSNDQLCGPGHTARGGDRPWSPFPTLGRFKMLVNIAQRSQFAHRPTLRSHQVDVFDKRSAVALVMTTSPTMHSRLHTHTRDRTESPQPLTGTVCGAHQPAAHGCRALATSSKHGSELPPIGAHTLRLTGSVKRNAAPPVSRFSAQILPPYDSMIVRTIDNPRPVPCFFEV